MRIFFLFMLTITLAFSSDKKIILGSYVQEINSSHSLDKVQKIIQDDAALQKLIQINHLSVQVEMLGQYHVVSVATFTDYVQLLRTLKAFRKHYADVYVLPPYKATTILADKKEVIPKTPEVETVPIQKTQEVEKVEKVIEVVQDMHKDENLSKEESTNEVSSIPKEEAITEKTVEPSPLPVLKDIEEPVEQRTLFTMQTILTIAIGVILLIILLGILFKMNRSTKEDKNTQNF